MVWEGSGEDLGRFWESFGKVLGFKRQAFWEINLFPKTLVFFGGGLVRLCMNLFSF